MGPSPSLKNKHEISNALWEQIELVLLAADPPKATGRKRVDQRRLLDAVVYKIRTSCRWNSLPKELGDDSTVHRAYQRWVRLGVFDKVWAMVEESQEIGAVSSKSGSVTLPAGRPEAHPEKSGQTAVGESRGRRAS